MRTPGAQQQLPGDKSCTQFLTQHKLKLALDGFTICIIAVCGKLIEAKWSCEGLARGPRLAVNNRLMLQARLDSFLQFSGRQLQTSIVHHYTQYLGINKTLLGEDV